MRGGLRGLARRASILAPEREELCMLVRCVHTFAHVNTRKKSVERVCIAGEEGCGGYSHSARVQLAHSFVRSITMRLEMRSCVAIRVAKAVALVHAYPSHQEACQIHPVGCCPTWAMLY